MTRLATIGAAALLAAMLAAPAAADTLYEALATAYASNPELGAQRAIVRQNDELVPQALSFYLRLVTP